jgi:hypothetical protein
MAGCVQTGQRPYGQRGLLFGKKKADDEIPPPPSLSIPGAATSTLAAPGQETAVAPAPLALTAATAEALPQANQGPDLKPNAPASPPLVAPNYSAAPSNPLAPLRELYQNAAIKHASLDSYTLRLRRREVVGNQSRPEEILLFKWRKDPWSVYFKWLGAEGKGREVVYVKGHYDNKLHTLTAAGDIPLLPAGKRFPVNPDGVLVKSKSRYPITEAGLGGLIDRFGKLLEAQERGDTHQGTLKYLGAMKVPEYENKVEGVLQTIPPMGDPNLARGGQRLWFFDPVLHLPMLIITKDDTGREVEYYCHDRFMYPVNLTDDDFNPDVLWKAPPSH